MPLIHDPKPSTAGPGSAFAGTGIQNRGRRRRKKRVLSKPSSNDAMQTPPPATTNSMTPSSFEWDEGEGKSSNKNNKGNNTMEKKFHGNDPPNKVVMLKNRALKKKPATTPSPGSWCSSLTSPLGFLPTLQTTLTPTTTTTLPPKPATCQQKRQHIRHALMVDTRMLDTEQGRKVSHKFLGQTRSFLSQVAKRGAPPCMVASSCIGVRKPKLLGSNNSSNIKGKRNGGGVTTKVVRLTDAIAKDMEEGNNNLESLIHNVAIRPPLNSGNVQNTNAVKVPTRFLASASWNLFGDLVESVVIEDRNSVSKCPLSGVILTNDLAFFCDTREESHKQALGRFWRKIRDMFQTTSIRSIEIIVLETGSVKAETSGNKPKSTDDNDNMSTEDHAPPVNHDQQIARCIQSIKKSISSRSEADYKANRGSDKSATPIVLSISLLGMTPRPLTSLCRKWLSQIVSAPDCRGRLSFELPETIDGIQCAVSLDARYKVLPFRADSPVTASLLEDLRRLSASKLEAVQLVPVSCIDTALFFGVPMAVMAGFENSIEQYHEMKSLIHFLLQYLSEHDVALLIRSSDPSVTIQQERPTLYHMDGQMFLLIAEELPGQQLADTDSLSPEKKRRPVEAMLFRYASAEQLLDVGSASISFPEGDSEMLKQLSDYIESSLEELKCDFVNPLVLYEETKRNDDVSETISDTPMNDYEEDDTSQNDWNDDSGVGARAKVQNEAFASSHKKNAASTPVTEESSPDWNDDSGVGARTKGIHQGADHKKKAVTSTIDTDGSPQESWNENDGGAGACAGARPKDGCQDVAKSHNKKNKQPPATNSTINLDDSSDSASADWN